MESSNRYSLGRIDGDTETVSALDEALRRGTLVDDAPTTGETYEVAGVTLRASVERPTNLIELA